MKIPFKKTLLTALVAMLLSANVAAKPVLKDVFVVSSVNGAIATDKAKNAKIEDKVKLYCVAQMKDNDQSFYYTTADKIKLEDKVIDESLIKKWNEQNGKIGIEWFKVESEGYNYYNGERTQVQNGKAVRAWLWDKIKYVETPIYSWDNHFECKADVTPSAVSDRGQGTGTMRYKVKVKYENQIKESPGKESVYSGERGITNKVHRISIRKDDSYAGWLHSFFNLPYIWGSDKLTKDEKTHQSEMFIGADCADLVVAGRRIMGYDIPYFASYGFAKNGIYEKYADRIVNIADLRENGIFYNGDKKIKISTDASNTKDVKIGDIVYFGGHVGVLSEDNNPKGVLDTNDKYINTLFDVPAEESFENAYNSSFSILRWREKCKEK